MQTFEPSRAVYSAWLSDLQFRRAALGSEPKGQEGKGGYIIFAFP